MKVKVCTYKKEKNMKKLLKNIFYNYKNKYNLQTNLNLGNCYGCYFNYLPNIISYDIEWTKQVCVRGYTEGYDTEKVLIFSLLHEIKHAIDYTVNPTNLLKEANSIDRNRYFLDYNYSANLPLEKRANEFAKQEIEKRENKL